MENLINEMDFDLLRQQKETLIRLTNSNIITYAECEDIEGIISIIDKIQDFAVDEMGIDENIVFNFDNEK